jgi:hypothetical protein
MVRRFIILRLFAILVFSIKDSKPQEGESYD